MRLCANRLAQFFVQQEYCEVGIDSDRLIISSAESEERIPFSIWNGSISISRGLAWGTLTFYSHCKDGQQLAWTVQGLPWKSCKSFAREAMASYEAWHKTQCAQLSRALPGWQESLDLLIKQPSYLTHSELELWRERVANELSEINTSLPEAELRMPNAMASVSDWIEHGIDNLEKRNEEWLNLELENWSVLFAQIENSPLNLSQQQAVLINNDHNLILAGAGTGKTSVLTARVAYLLQSHLAQAGQLLMLAFGSEAAKEMRERLDDKIGLASEKVSVNTFHQLGLKILNSVENEAVVISPVATEKKLKQAWCSEWLKQHWTNPANFKRWQKHLTKWPIAYLTGDEELGGQTENPKLISWLDSQVEQLCMLHMPKKQVQERIVDHEDYSRLNSELSLVWPCYQAWQKMLKEENQIDFHSMITKATVYVEKGKFKSPWKYIMVDEYQDISPDRLALIEALCNQTLVQNDEQVKPSLFAVGDDWQSIYQFAGSDVDLTTDFSGRYSSSTIHKLDTTYRFNSQIGAVANQFVQQNPAQIEKELNSFKVQKQKAVVVMPQKYVEKELEGLNSKAAGTKTVLLLARNHYHKPECLAEWQKRFSNLRISFMTCHGSKGKEADYVFVLNVDKGQFPGAQRQLHLNSVLTQTADDYPFAEERRLFYVALTRAREKVWVSYETHESEFVEELISANYPILKKR
ncbi:DNA helicase IV [Vibrio sp. JC009]|uniref:DNA helicase IV n=1 Tax=Vibrio sp. JC009 TaxID=2912314 RepID=UPI0023AF5FEF|nr:DNA helicase IV [Vibrio sp. JC009]WED24228.1 DNA helicase IV [Vibrio sp. JC009]